MLAEPSLLSSAATTGGVGLLGLAGELRCHQQPTPRPSFSVGPAKPRRGREAVPDSGRGGWLFLEARKTLACEIFSNCFWPRAWSLAPSIPDFANFVGACGWQARGRAAAEEATY